MTHDSKTISGTLSGQTIFITGATAGFGLACAQLFVREGARVIATGRRENLLEKLQEQLGEGVYTIALDVRDRAAVEKAISTLPAAWANVDVLVNNAGLALGLEPITQTAVEDLEQMVDTNIKGVIYCTKSLLPGMIARGRGHIVNLGSIAGTYPYPGGNVYGATKAFLKQFSLNLRSDLLGLPIRVTNIEPGMADTEFSVVRFKGDRQKAAGVYERMQPLTAQDIARTIHWAITQPNHVNINAIEIMPTMQAFSPFAVHRAS